MTLIKLTTLSVLTQLLVGCGVGMDAFAPLEDVVNATLDPNTSLRFDVTPVTGVYTEESLFVVPAGSEPFEVLDIWVEGPDADSFHTEDIDLPLLVSRNQEAELIVGFSANRTGTHGATIYVLVGVVGEELLQEGREDALSVRAEGMGCRDDNSDRQCDPN